MKKKFHWTSVLLWSALYATTIVSDASCMMRDLVDNTDPAQLAVMARIERCHAQTSPGIISGSPCVRAAPSLKCKACQAEIAVIKSLQANRARDKLQQQKEDERSAQEAALRQKTLSEIASQASSKARLEQLAVEEAELRVQLLRAQLAALNTQSSTTAAAATGLTQAAKQALEEGKEKQ